MNEAPWWLEEGDEFCACCEAAYHNEALIYCVACDRAMCSVCVISDISTKEVLCMECQTQARNQQEQDRLSELEGER